MEDWYPWCVVIAFAKQGICLFVIAHKGFTTMVANEAWRRQSLYLNQVPRDRRLNVPSEGHEGDPSAHLGGGMAEFTLKKEISLSGAIN